MLRALVLVSLALAAGPAAAQVNYGGYDIGPDYGAMFEEQMRQFDAFGTELRERERQVTEQAMADPLCQRLYQGEPPRAGRMAFPDFAYLCWATRYFSPDGIAYFQQVERDNANRERLALIDLRRMEVIRAEAQNEWSAGFETNNLEFGAVLVDRNAYLDPYSGATVELPTFSEPNQMHWDPGTQAYYTMNTAGQIVTWRNEAWQVIERAPRR